MASSPADVLHALRWRYATKKFDPAKKIPGETWAALEEVLILTPSSMGMQPWKFIVVTDPAMKARLRPAAHNQAQVVDCSHFVVFAVRKNLDDAHIDRLFTRSSEVHGVPEESLAGYRKSGTSLIEQARTEGRLDTWQTHQLYIALGNFMTSAAILGVDTCPMEGIQPPQFDEMLGLVGTPYSTVVACAAGYRHPDDKSAARKKVRFKPEDVIVRI
jgi:nitroreductase